jgi:hypothetical protein
MGNAPANDHPDLEGQCQSTQHTTVLDQCGSEVQSVDEAAEGEVHQNRANANVGKAEEIEKCRGKT